MDINIYLTPVAGASHHETVSSDNNAMNEEIKSQTAENS